jgi:hypothetical protein
MVAQVFLFGIYKGWLLLRKCSMQASVRSLEDRTSAFAVRFELRSRKAKENTIFGEEDGIFFWLRGKGSNLRPSG